MKRREFRLLISTTLSLCLLAATSITSRAWQNGGYTRDYNLPKLGTHDWIALHAINWLPDSERWWIERNLNYFLVGTELPDNWAHPLGGIGDVWLHHVYYNSSEALVDDSAATRALAEYNLVLAFLKVGNYSAAALHAGIMSHYLSDMGVFGHVMGKGTDWGNETHHLDYETIVETRTNEYPNDDFTVYINYDGVLLEIDSYNATLQIAYDTTFDVDGDLTAVWMDTHYNWSDPTFKGRAGESINLSVNVLADVLHTLYERMEPDTIMSNFETLFRYNEVRMIYPSNVGGKPLGRSAASVSDWLASMAISTKLLDLSEGEDTASAFVDQTSGKAIGDPEIGIVSFGGPAVNVPIYYYEVNKIAPVIYSGVPGAAAPGQPWAQWYFANGTAIQASALGNDEHNDLFLMEVFKDGDGRYVLLAYGIGWKGTYAASKYFDRVIYPSLEWHQESWVIVKWEDSNGDGFVNGPGDGDTYTILASSS